MPDIPVLILVACLAIGAPRGACVAEVEFDPDTEIEHSCIATHPWGDLSWVTPAWPLYAAHIVASEARGVPSADIAIACTLVGDVVEGGYLDRPFELDDHGRWNGWGTPDAADEKAVYQALLTNVCTNMPRYRFIGNFGDVQHWTSIGMIGEGPFDLYLGTAGQAVVGVP